MKAFFIAALMFLLLAFPSQASEAAVHALKIWGLNITPSLFPYMVLCQSLMSQLKLSSPKTPFLISALGLLGGSPSGSAALAAGMSGLRYSFKQLLAFCALTGTISPMFFLGPVSQWMHSSSAGRRLLIVHILGAILSAALVYFVSPYSADYPGASEHDQKESLNPILRSVHAIMNVGGCIVFFSVAASFIKTAFPFIGTNAKAFLHALLEVSGGVEAISQSEFPYLIRMILSASALGFGGFSILAQNLVFLQPLGVKMKHLVLIGLIRAIIGGLLMLLMLLLQ